jgi:hypothetical protein
MLDDATPVDVYRAIIDQLVNETRHLGSSAHVAKHQFFSKAPAHSEFNEFIRSLTEDQRLVLARMLEEERHCAIGDLLAALSWWIDCHDVGLTYQGKPMPVDLSGMGLHGDFIARVAGDEWPADR